MTNETPEEKTDRYLKEIKRQADIISTLLADPQPGLATWCFMYGNAMNRITELWDQGSDAL